MDVTKSHDSSQEEVGSSSSKRLAESDASLPDSSKRTKLSNGGGDASDSGDSGGVQIASVTTAEQPEKLNASVVVISEDEDETCEKVEEKSAGKRQADDENDEEDEEEEDDDCTIVSVTQGSHAEYVRHLRAQGLDPRALLTSLLGSDMSGYQASEDALWHLLLRLVSEPTRRRRLDTVTTLDDVVRLLATCRRILVLTGAGVSVSCGIPDFRSRDGIYARLSKEYPELPDPQSMFDIRYFRTDQRPFFKFAKEIYPGQFTPSRSHRFIKCLEDRGKLLRNYSQNIDTLEQVAGITRVLNCHGSFATASCVRCRLKVDMSTIEEDIMAERIPLCPRCTAKGDSDRDKSDTAGGGTTDETASDVSKKPTDGNEKAKGEEAEDAKEQSKKDEEQEAKQKMTDEHKDGEEKDKDKEGSKELKNRGEEKDEKVKENVEKGEEKDKEAKEEYKECTDDSGSSEQMVKPVLKPDIVFFGESLPQEFYDCISADEDEADLLIVMGSSLKVQPVSLIPSSLPGHIPQILINREPLHQHNFDVCLLGDCDQIVAALCERLDWQEVAGEPLTEISGDELLVRRERAYADEEGQQAGAAQHEDDCHIAQFLPPGSYAFCPPNKYVFSGAEAHPDEIFSVTSEEDSDLAELSSAAEEDEVVNLVTSEEEGDEEEAGPSGGVKASEEAAEAAETSQSATKAPETAAAVATIVDNSATASDAAENQSSADAAPEGQKTVAEIAESSEDAVIEIKEVEEGEEPAVAEVAATVESQIGAATGQTGEADASFGNVAEPPASSMEVGEAEEEELLNCEID